MTKKTEESWIVPILLIIGVLVVGGGLFSIVQEPPHVVHTIKLSDRFVGGYFEDDPHYWETPRMKSIVIPPQADIDYSMVYKYGFIGDVYDTDGESMDIQLYKNPICDSISERSTDGDIYWKDSCTYDSIFSFDIRDPEDYVEQPSLNHYQPVWSDTTGVPYVELGINGNYRTDISRWNDIYLVVYEKVECTTDFHCVSASPSCNIDTNKCETVISAPDVPAPSGLTALMNDLMDWLKSIINNFIYK